MYYINLFFIAVAVRKTFLHTIRQLYSFCLITLRKALAKALICSSSTSSVNGIHQCSTLLHASVDKAFCLGVVNLSGLPDCCFFGVVGAVIIL